MARPNFNLNLAGDGTVQIGNNPPTVSTFTDAFHSQETQAGTTRHKPQVSFITPTGYSFLRIAWKRGYGVTAQGSIKQSGFIPNLNAPSNSYNNYCARNGYPQSSVPGSVSSAALAQARRNLKSQDINVGVAFGELGQTAALFATNAKKISSAFRSFTKGDFRGVAKNLGIDYRHPSKSLSNFMLEYAYGVKPLISDVYGAAKAIETSPADHWLVTVRGRRTQTYGGDGSFSKFVVAGSGSIDSFSSNDFRLVVSSKVRIDAVPTNPGLIKMNQLGVTNPAAIAWELVPYSFVVDWFLPIGDFLNSMDATLGWTIKGFTQSDFYKGSLSMDGIALGTVTTNNWHGNYSRVSVDRSAGTTVPFPFLPNMGKSLTQGHVQNGLALLRSALPKRL